MQRSSYQDYADQQNKIANFNLAKAILINVGIIFTSFTLILVGIFFLADFKDLILVLSLRLCMVLALACFLTVVPVTGKLKQMRAEKRYNFRSNW